MGSASHTVVRRSAPATQLSLLRGLVVVQGMQIRFGSCLDRGGWERRNRKTVVWREYHADNGVGFWLEDNWRGDE